jgi:hypothetical protein
MAESLAPTADGRRANGVRRSSRVRLGETTRFAVADQKGYVTTGRDRDGELLGTSAAPARPRRVGRSRDAAG